MFHKWPSIENHYNVKNIDYWLELYPELEQEVFCITEKLHGTNVQFIISKNKFKLATRNRILPESEDFFGIWNIIPKYEDTISNVQNFIKNNDDVKYINIYGELIGPNIQKGVDYGNEKRIVFFSTRINGILLSFDEFLYDIVYTKKSKLMLLEIVPILGYFTGLEKALSFDVENLPSTYINDKNNNAEGVVIYPCKKHYRDDNDRYFILKKKAEKFLEKNREQRKPRNLNLSPEIEYLKNEFESLINENRIESVFSKEGKIKDDSQIGDYIKLIMEDALEDFSKDNDISQLDKKNRKLIFNKGGSIVAEILKQKLREN